MKVKSESEVAQSCLTLSDPMVAALFTIARRWKQAIKVWYFHAVKYYLAIKSKGPRKLSYSFCIC